MQNQKRLKLKHDVGKLNFSSQEANLQTEKSRISSHQKFELGKSSKIRCDDGKMFIVSYDELVEESLLGHGEFGVVKKMFHKPSKMKFAVKMLNEDLFDNNLNETSKNSSLMDLEVSIKIGNGCPFLIQFYGALYADSYIWILSEIMDTSLEKFCSKASFLHIKLPESFYALISYSVLSALSYMKNLKLIHRDIKPSNILLNSNNGDVKLCDFGISGWTSENSVCNTFKGCQRYMAPEKIKITENGYTIKSDIWSLGISLIEICTGIHPYIHAKGPFDLSTMILLNESPKLDSSKYSKHFCVFVDSCLIKDPLKRSTCTDLLESKFITENLDNGIVMALMKLIIDEIKKDEISQKKL